MVSTGDFIGRRVGRFTITSHLASGGMAELFVARQEAVGGFEKDLVLKMLQERYAENPRVVEMFLDEARLAAKLNHQNIVHVYDVDEADGIRYIAMEYIHGETVTDIIRRSIARGSFLPLEHAIHIIGETAAGLAYAHESRNPEGRAARIVHRDVSPSNILVTFEGLTKIVDFGIARVQDQIREESGMRPGKVSYMSPEQVRGEPADHRSDIFSLGIILYEITVGRRLWRGPAEQVMRRIVEESIPPPTYVRRDYPPALELIVMKALERRPADRYQSAADLQHDLSEFMEEAGLKSGSRRLSQYMKELFAPDSAADEGKQQPGKQAEGGPSGQGAQGAQGGLHRTPTGGPAVPSSLTDLEDPEELDFDRRAPLMMRMEARPDSPPGPSDRHGSAASGSRDHVPPARPIPRAAPRPGAAPGSERPARPGLGLPVAGAATPTASPDPDYLLAPSTLPPGTPSLRSGIPSAGVPGTASGPHWTRAAPAIGSASDMGSGLPGPGASSIVTTGGAGAGAVNPSSSPTDSLGAGLRWVIVLVLAVALVVVFLATR